MEARVRERLRFFAVFELQPPWGDRTNHGGGWVVGETRVRGLYSRNAANGTPRAAPEASSFLPGSCGAEPANFASHWLMRVRVFSARSSEEDPAE